jgi:hypothetical protein
VTSEDKKEYARQFLSNIPEDPPVSPFMQTRRVPSNDPRKALRGSMGCNAHKGTPTPPPSQPGVFSVNQDLFPLLLLHVHVL